MKAGVLISVLAHGILLLLVILEPQWKSSLSTQEIEITEVTLMSAAEFEAQISDSPMIPDANIQPMNQPDTDLNDATRPDDAVAPEKTVIDVTEAPTERDSDPDLSAVERLAQPNVATEAFQPFSAESLPQISPIVSQGETGTSLRPVFKTVTPRAAPRIDSFAAPALPEDARVSDKNSEATTPDETADTEVEESEAESLPESVTEIVPEAILDVEPTAAPPRRRSSNVQRTAQAIEQAKREAEEAQRKAEAEELQKQQEQEAADIAALLEEASAEVEQPVSITLSGGQRQGIIEAVSRNWNKSIVLGKENYENLIVTVAVQVASNGAIISDVEPVTPANPSGDFLVAFDAARRSVLRAEVIPLPAGQFPDGVRLILKFDPAYDSAGLN